MIKKKKIYSQKFIETTKILYIYSTLNNLIVTLTDKNGKTILWSSAGNTGFTGARKKTNFAAQQTINKIINIALTFGFKKYKIIINGFGPGIEPALQALDNEKILIKDIIFRQKIAYNGCRAPQKRKI